jgi:hypothetical protein
MRPKELARELGISPRTLRAWLRMTYPRDARDGGRPWVLTGAQRGCPRGRFGRVADRLDRIDGAFERAQRGLDAAAAGRTVPLDEL